MHSGKLIIFSAPSGSGKTSIVKRLVAENLQLGFSISACTRDKRGRKEEHGKDYYFLTPEEFKKKILKNLQIRQNYLSGRVFDQNSFIFLIFFRHV